MGTFVEISLSGYSQSQRTFAIEQAFLEITRVEKAMSFHDGQSELSRLNRLPVNQWMGAGPGLLEVLNFAEKLYRLSGGQFNVAIGGLLRFWKWLPALSLNLSAIQKVCWDDLQCPGFEIQETQVRRILDIEIDLGGIAKGYAVDRAVQRVQEILPAAQGLVNAGGDMRSFGLMDYPVAIRCGLKNKSRFYKINLCNQALATSTVSFRSGQSAYINILKKASVRRQSTVFVRSHFCMIADALTKVAFLLDQTQAADLAAHFGAEIGVAL